MAKLIFGCGYLGRRVGRLWLAGGDDVFVVTRSPNRAEQLAAEGFQPLVADITSDTFTADTLAAGESPLSLPKSIKTVLFAVGYDRGGSGSIHDVYVGGLGRVLVQLPPAVQRLIYISSTGVFGQAAGDQVDEDSACQPTREGGRACLAAEQLLQSSLLADRSIILRLAGIYGPARIPRSKDLLAGRPIDAPAAGWLNLIHVEDAARIVLAAEQQAEPPKLYVVSDGQPVLRDNYYRHLANLLGSPAPRFVEPPADSPAAARAGSDKRVNPWRLYSELSPELLYPSYREGLAAIVAEQAPA
ncbi:MAG: NAD-dependent epimerase/dehydratase family protein [Pirellulaceae bacterium]